MKSISLRRLKALCWKETLQIFRDPSSNLIAFVLPVIMLLIFGYGINLDSSRLRIGVLNEDSGKDAHAFVSAMRHSAWLDVRSFQSRELMEKSLVDSQIRGFVIIPQDFTKRLENASDTAPVQLVADGSEPNIAQFVNSTVSGVWQSWQLERADDHGTKLQRDIVLEPRYWFNPSAESRNFLIPGSITVIMTVIGALLTSLVVAREWERGTMEALLASPVTRAELLLSKVIPYYVLGMVSLLLCVGVAHWGLRVPFRGGILALSMVGSFFLFSVLGIGLAISTATRNQFNAAQAALNAAFLPAMMLSGFIYEISSMPPFLRGVTHLIPARYFVSSMQTIFQAGSLWSVLLPDILMLMASSALFIGLTAKLTRRRME
ncbi:ABC transporter permease [Luteolibacter pohnpeiensis]|uniref:ABC transporter permease n=1 Tax=Luteolibacter pohnpeiensis TaxID=454153 RepID=A0A934S846_9BACT|nr:ABC transporter permease [Luteolibacter pohnpeiensis]MBK1881442.1 ABC transporter permease [Luteolibacter pohnpeiensis]